MPQGRLSSSPRGLLPEFSAEGRALIRYPAVLDEDKISNMGASEREKILPGEGERDEKTQDENGRINGVEGLDVVLTRVPRGGGEVGLLPFKMAAPSPTAASRYSTTASRLEMTRMLQASQHGLANFQKCKNERSDDLSDSPEICQFLQNSRCF
ncbi:Hypothetical protein NTJ_07510 [Nesidiocoris tenuis]|uniref:Uncharacterized protein n=1 Tax=Nesidiocoris tenuis TaxID=355587 RepID=A0ABN7AR64_9HEMI|nr:Hypothetical protein NTJ_07510 [Nesidiocoris tenuis]